MHRIVLATTFGLLVTTGLAVAQQAPAIHEGHLNQIDTNKDGGVSKSEYQSFMNAAFAKLDTNGDGVLSQAEVSKVVTADQFSSLDANNDDNVSRNEFMNQVMKDFASADRGSDGQLK